MKVLFNYFKEEDDVEILVLVDGTIGEIENAERTICDEIEAQYDNYLEFVKEEDIILYDSDDEMSLLEEIDEEDDDLNYELCAVIYDKKRYTLKSLEYALSERVEENDK